MKSRLSSANENFLPVIAIFFVAAISFGFFVTILNNENFIPAPLIISFSPDVTEQMPATVVITGSNFSAVIAENELKINGVTAQIIGATSSQLVTLVPTGATSGKITLTVNGMSTTSAADFVIKKNKSETPLLRVNTSFRINSKSKSWVKGAS